VVRDLQRRDQRGGAEGSGEGADLRDEVSALRASTAALLDATNAAFGSRIG
jgi:hypothetical protein